MAGTPAQKGYNEEGNTDSSRKTVTLAGWATPQQRDNKGQFKKHTKSGSDLSNQALGATSPSSPAPTQGDAQKVTPFHDAPQPALAYQVHLAGWATPQERDGKGIDQNYQHGAINNSLPNQIEALGATSTSSPAQTEKRGALNPALPRWLMGFPAEWDSCGATAIQSVRKSRQSSSRRGKKREAAGD